MARERMGRRPGLLTVGGVVPVMTWTANWGQSRVTALWALTVGAVRSFRRPVSEGTRPR
jgi:hypothetical protein